MYPCTFSNDNLLVHFNSRSFFIEFNAKTWNYLYAFVQLFAGESEVYILHKAFRVKHYTFQPKCCFIFSHFYSINKVQYIYNVPLYIQYIKDFKMSIFSVHRIL